MPNVLLAIVLLALLACFLGLSLGALGLLLPVLLPGRVETARQYLRVPSLWMGLAHGLLLLLLLSRAEHRPLVGLLGVIWLVFALFCLALGAAAGIEQVGFLLWPEGPRLRRSLGSALVVAWACAVPYLGQVLALCFLLTAYGAGLGGWTRRPRSSD